GLDGRRLLHRIDRKAGTVTIDGTAYPLKDTHFPTLDPANPYELSAEEKACLARMKQSFLTSRKLWEHMKFLGVRGSMYLIPHDSVSFQGCVPVDDRGAFLPMVVDGKERVGKELFDALEEVIARALDRATDKERDLMWYLWCGPRSPLFGKDK